MKDKFGSYINSLMATVVDKEAAEFIKELALEELKRLNVNIKEFLHKYEQDASEEVEKTEKQLLQEKKQNG